MRPVRISNTARTAFQTMLEQGAEKFGIAVAMEKERLVYDAMHSYLAEYPHHGLTTPGTAFRHHLVDRTPFVVVYEYDDTELRVLFIKHRHADRRDLDLRDVEW